jgi:hypothetical protein
MLKFMFQLRISTPDTVDQVIVRTDLMDMIARLITGDGPQDGRSGQEPDPGRNAEDLTFGHEKERSQQLSLHSGRCASVRIAIFQKIADRVQVEFVEIIELVLIVQDQIGIRLIEISHAAKELLLIVLMRLPGLEHKQTTSDRLVGQQGPSIAIFGVIWKSQVFLRMLTNYLHYFIKKPVVGNVGVNRMGTPLKTTGNKAVRVFE